ncbi:hypothetical protein COV13_01240 [Candidatus Woesearchaeota archaeon CG10_big_fil_rev_8_21_14_0_10_32_9]|nr:MAG: hypothetical protein COV13_01240 [Candidatus Woesearchaeota archaeon CG10_big_fil_rev_8_21_14_0_10_32_9]
MDVKIISQNKVTLPRQELLVEVSYEEITPSRAQLKQSIATKAKAKEGLVIVKSIKNHYGSRTALVSTYVYDTEDAMKAIEFPKVLNKNGIKKEEPKSEEAKGASE